MIRDTIPGQVYVDGRLSGALRTRANGCVPVRLLGNQHREGERASDLSSALKVKRDNQTGCRKGLNRRLRVVSEILPNDHDLQNHHTLLAARTSPLVRHKVHTGAQSPHIIGTGMQRKDLATAYVEEGGWL